MRAREDDADFAWSDGVHLTGTAIWCDAPRQHQLTFVSSANRPIGRSESAQARVLMTERTFVLCGRPAGALVTPSGRPFALGRLRLELLHSGHLPGAAQLLVERDGRRVLYAGDVNPQAGRLAEPAQLRAADAIALSAPLAPLSVERSLPPRDQVEQALLAAVRGALDDRRVPILFVPPFGAAAESAALLAAAGLPLRAHPRLARLFEGYRSLQLFPRALAPSLRGRAEGAALLWPIALGGSPVLKKIPRATRLLVAGEAIDPAAVARVGAEAGFPLADHGDLASLVEHATQAGARDVYFTCGLTEAVAQAFTRRRLRVHPLGPPEQIQLFG